MSDILLTLVEIAQLALRRHADALARQPKRGATAYLRAALRCARQMANQSKQHPELLAAAVEIADRVLRDAQAAEASVFARGGNSAAYLSVLAAAAATRLTILDAQQRQAQKGTAPEQNVAARPEPRPAAPLLSATSPRRISAKPVPPVARPPHYRKASGVKLAAS